LKFLPTPISNLADFDYKIEKLMEDEQRDRIDCATP